jgi:hypothetical protein
MHKSMLLLASLALVALGHSAILKQQQKEVQGSRGQVGEFEKKSRNVIKKSCLIYLF